MIHLLVKLLLPLKDGIEIVGLIGPCFRAKDRNPDDVSNDLFQRLSVLFVHGEQEKRQHDEDHGQRRKGCADVILQQEERRQQREAKAQDVLYKYPDMYSAKEAAILRSDLRYLAKARQVLTTEERTLLVWIFEKKMPTKEAARILNISEGAVRVRQHRILGKLKQEILRLKKEEEEI